MSGMKELFAQCSTMMSINDRFTYLQKQARPMQTTVQTIRANNVAQNLASAKNRRLALQMERRMTALAALKLKKKSIRQRLGMATPIVRGGIKDRLTLPVRGRGRARMRGRPRRPLVNLRRTQSLQSLHSDTLQRSRSMQSLNEAPLGRGRSRSRSRSRARTPSRGPMQVMGARRQRSNSVGRQGRQQQRAGSVGPQRRFSTGGFNQQGNRNTQPQQRRGRSRSGFRNQRINNQGIRNNRNNRNNRRGPRNTNFIGSGGGGGGGGGARGGFRRGNNNRFRRGGGGGGGGGNNAGDRSGGRAFGGGGRGRFNRRNSQSQVKLPSREELDKQLDQYMANTKSEVRELLGYMK